MLTPASDACRENSSNVKLYKNFKEVTSIKTNYAAEGLSGGTLLGVRGSDFVCFYDWTSGKVGPDFQLSQVASWQDTLKPYHQP